MAEVKITGKPWAVRYLTAPQVSGDQSDIKLSASWSVPLENTQQSSNCRSEGQAVLWTIKCRKGKGAKEREVKFWDYPSASATSSTLDLIPHLGPTFFYPRDGNNLITGVVVGVSSANVKGKSAAVNEGAYLFDPVAPTMGEPEFDEHGILTVPVECKQNTPRQPLYDVKWTREVYDSQLKTTATATGTVGDGTGDVDFDVTFDAVSYQVFQENPNRFLKMTAKAYARGMHGDSKEVSKSVYLSLPLRPVIQGVQVSQGSYTDRVTVRFTTKTDGVNQNVLNQHPFTGCRIQYLKNVTETNAATAYAMDGWENYDIEDNGACTALYVPASVVRPDPDKITWIRVKCWNQSEEVLWRASVPYRLTALETESPTAEDDVVVLAPLTLDDDGTSILADLYWNKNGTDDSTGTQVDWSTDGYAWKSTVGPSTYNTLRDDGAATYGGVRYRSHTTLYIRDLEEGKLYHVKARRYREGDGDTTYGDWSQKRAIMVCKVPKAVTLSAPPRIAHGEPLPLSWAVSGTGESQPELSWQVNYGGGPNVTPTDAAFTPRYVFANSSGGTRTTIPWSKIEEMLDKIAKETPSIAKDKPSRDLFIPVSVSVSVKGGYMVTSETSYVAVKNPPAVSVEDFAVTAQPVSFVVGATEELSAIDVVVRSLGVASDLPDGRLMQEPGHVMWSGRLVGLDATAGDETYTHRYAVALPPIDGLVDNALYTVSVRGTAALDGSASGVDERDFRVEWDHPAAPPDDFTIVPTDYVDDAGNRHREATVTLAATGGEGDTYDLYRVTPDGATRVASGLSAGDSVTDPYAPFGELGGAYRVCTVTEDGAMAWRDEEYALRGHDMRIDFGSEYVELPYNVDMSDSFEKDFEERHHYGGGRPEGYWNEGVSRHASLSTDLIRVTDAEVARRVRMLAQHVGPCFVRLPNGCAFEADVQVTDLSEGHASSAIAVALDVTEVSPSGAYEIGRP